MQTAQGSLDALRDMPVAVSSSYAALAKAPKPTGVEKAFADMTTARDVVTRLKQLPGVRVHFPDAIPKAVNLAKKAWHAANAANEQQRKGGAELQTELAEADQAAQDALKLEADVVEGLKPPQAKDQPSTNDRRQVDLPLVAAGLHALWRSSKVWAQPVLRAATATLNFVAAMGVLVMAPLIPRSVVERQAGSGERS